MTIPIERRLASSQLRPLLGAYLSEGIEGEDLALFDRLLVQLAGGTDAYISGAALNSLLLKLEDGDPVQIALLELYAQKALDVVGVHEGEFVWVPTIGNQEDQP